MEPAAAPILGSRTWNVSDASLGHWVGTPIKWACPAGNFAFDVLFAATATGACSFNDSLNAAVWDYWLAPGLGMSPDPSRTLPNCIRTCKAKLNGTVTEKGQ
jgi:hypothetical protein